MAIVIDFLHFNNTADIYMFKLDLAISIPKDHNNHNDIQLVLWQLLNMICAVYQPNRTIESEHREFTKLHNWNVVVSKFNDGIIHHPARTRWQIVWSNVSSLYLSVSVVCVLVCNQYTRRAWSRIHYRACRHLLTHNLLMY